MLFRSTDSSSQIALQYSRNYPNKIYYLEHPNHQNLGKSISRNLGLIRANGEYFTFLDADDIWLPQKLDKQVGILDQQPEAAMVCGPTLMWFSWQKKNDLIGKDYYRQLGFPSNTLIPPIDSFKLYLKSKVQAPATCSVLIRHEVLSSVGDFSDVIHHMYEDQLFFVKIYLKHSIYIVDECFDWYRQHPNSCCYLAIKRGEYDPHKPNPSELKYLQALEQYLKNEGIVDSEIWGMINRKLLPYRHPYIYRSLNLIGKIRYVVGALKNIRRKLGKLVMLLEN